MLFPGATPTTVGGPVLESGRTLGVRAPDEQRRACRSTHLVAGVAEVYVASVQERRPSRRAVLRSGLGALAGLGALRLFEHVARAAPVVPLSPPGSPVDPVLALPSLGPSEVIGGVRFAPQWFGDWFPGNAIPFHAPENGASFPAPEESIDVAIVGGGLSGLASAYLLRHRRPVLFELRPRLGGNAMGESQGGRSWSLASAYFMQADADSELGRLYEELGIDHRWREDSGDFTFEYDGAVGIDLLGPSPSRQDIAALARYRKAVAHFSGDAYPELPFDGEVPASVGELDGRTFAEDLAIRCGPLPPRLAYLLQAYCCSSLGVGIDEVSAAAAWNFVAAEEFGRNVMVGGNAGLARALWRRSAVGGARFRCGAVVAEVLPVDGGSIIHWRDDAGMPRTTFARQVVLANAKHIVRSMLPWLAEVDLPKVEAMHGVPTIPYVVANVVLSHPIGRDFYDVYLQGGRDFPMDANAFESHRVITDAVNAGFAATGAASRAVTLYWPLPWHTARFTIVGEDDWRAYAALAAPQIAELAATLGIPVHHVRQVRLARWGHAMPYAVPGTYTSGLPQELRRPVMGKIWFVNQDNWLLPAVETCLTEAMWAAPQIDAALG